MPASTLNLDDLIANLRGEYQPPNINLAPRPVSPGQKRIPRAGGGNNSSNVPGDIAGLDRKWFGGFLGNLFGGGDDKKKNPDYQKAPYFSNAFNAPGTPTFDPLSGYFQGLDTGVPGQVDQPKAFKPSKTENDIRSLVRGLTQNFPQLLDLFNNQILPNELAQLQTSLITSPEYASLQRDIYSDNAMSAAESDKDILLGPGADIISIADKLQRQIDPEFYKTRESTADGLQDLLKPGLSRGEEVSIERSLNRNNGQQGNLNTPSNLSTVSNAMTYGGAARDRLSSAINQATQFLPASRSGVDVLQQGIKSPSSVSSAFSNARQNSGQDIFGAGNNALNQGTGISTNNSTNDMNKRIAKMGLPSGAEKVLSALPDYLIFIPFLLITLF